ncbi:MAG: alpha/beta fold hydrolase [Acidimicrobiales bacterium]
MAGYVERGTVRSWYDERGEGEPVVRLHGGAVDSRFFEHNVGPPAERFRVLAPDRRGHGRTADVEGPMTYDLILDDTIVFLEGVVDGRAHLVGHGVGAAVALLVALRGLVQKLVLISGGFSREGTVPGADQVDVDQVVAFLGGSYGEVSPDGEAHVRVVMEKLAAMALTDAPVAKEDLGASPTGPW